MALNIGCLINEEDGSNIVEFIGGAKEWDSRLRGNDDSNFASGCQDREYVLQESFV
jgi:hypothetical protein